MFLFVFLLLLSENVFGDYGVQSFKKKNGLNGLAYSWGKSERKNGMTLLDKILVAEDGDLSVEFDMDLVKEYIKSLCISAMVNFVFWGIFLVLWIVVGVYLCSCCCDKDFLFCECWENGSKCGWGLKISLIVTSVLMIFTTIIGFTGIGKFSKGAGSFNNGIDNVGKFLDTIPPAVRTGSSIFSELNNTIITEINTLLATFDLPGLVSQFDRDVQNTIRRIEEMLQVLKDSIGEVQASLDVIEDNEHSRVDKTGSNFYLDPPDSFSLENFTTMVDTFEAVQDPEIVRLEFQRKRRLLVATFNSLNVTILKTICTINEYIGIPGLKPAEMMGMLSDADSKTGYHFLPDSAYTCAGGKPCTEKSLATLCDKIKAEWEGGSSVEAGAGAKAELGTRFAEASLSSSSSSSSSPHIRNEDGDDFPALNCSNISSSSSNQSVTEDFLGSQGDTAFDAYFCSLEQVKKVLELQAQIAADVLFCTGESDSNGKIANHSSIKNLADCDTDYTLQSIVSRPDSNRTIYIRVPDEVSDSAHTATPEDSFSLGIGDTEFLGVLHDHGGGNDSFAEVLTGDLTKEFEEVIRAMDESVGNLSTDMEDMLGGVKDTLSSLKTTLKPVTTTARTAILVVFIILFIVFLLMLICENLLAFISPKHTCLLGGSLCFHFAFNVVLPGLVLLVLSVAGGFFYDTDEYVYGGELVGFLKGEGVREYVIGMLDGLVGESEGNDGGGDRRLSLSTKRVKDLSAFFSFGVEVNTFNSTPLPSFSPAYPLPQPYFHLSSSSQRQKQKQLSETEGDGGGNAFGIDTASLISSVVTNLRNDTEFFETVIDYYFVMDSSDAATASARAVFGRVLKTIRDEVKDTAERAVFVTTQDTDNESDVNVAFMPEDYTSGIKLEEAVQQIVNTTLGLLFETFLPNIFAVLRNDAVSGAIYGAADPLLLQAGWGVLLLWVYYFFLLLLSLLHLTVLALNRAYLSENKDKEKVNV